ncbi:S1C family serine protease [Mucilaginibacter paludis]|uniref:Peptidase S1 and S6 chymotrypsin/Hap n=1 Tax=Mucilaginibacter paludis DSM 18603 TaxID=714943 RepID=H1Y7L6_9SPHI|nr:S1C family serine protease [Mucilaginibacter paludis]EHQ29437.1 peptidase S1 and S6 chymotrypsin/Hap [Mucilaginibacter paludis DSM 18603]
MSDIELIAIVERYLNGEMSADERLRFEVLRRENTEVDSTVKEHQEFTNRLKQYGERLEFESLLNAIHDEIDVQTLKDEFVHHPSIIVRLWRNHHSKISMAASIAIFAVLGTLFFTGYLKTQDQQSELVAMRRRVDREVRSNENFRRTTTAMIKDIRDAKKSIDHNKYAGSGFAVSADGYIVTNNHVISGADSVYIQNSAGDEYRVKTVYTDPKYDIAILKIVDRSFTRLSSLPYGFKRTKSDLGEDVYTVGYPGDDFTYVPGNLSAATGFNGDTINYRISIPVNPGNSGGPVLDSKGNVIGIISARASQAEGAAFAIKSKYLQKAINAIPSDSLKSKINLNTRNSIASMTRVQQIKKIQNYIFMVKVYN